MIRLKCLNVHATVDKDCYYAPLVVVMVLWYQEKPSLRKCICYLFMFCFKVEFAIFRWRSHDKGDGQIYRCFHILAEREKVDYGGFCEN